MQVQNHKHLLATALTALMLLIVVPSAVADPPNHALRSETR